MLSQSSFVRVAAIAGAALVWSALPASAQAPNPRPVQPAVASDQQNVPPAAQQKEDAVERAVKRFGIGVDSADGLLRQGALGYQLTWMDAKVGDLVVTPRRGLSPRGTTTSRTPRIAGTTS